MGHEQNKQARKGNEVITVSGIKRIKEVDVGREEEIQYKGWIEGCPENRAGPSTSIISRCTCGNSAQEETYSFRLMQDRVDLTSFTRTSRSLAKLVPIQKARYAAKET